MDNTQMWTMIGALAAFIAALGGVVALMQSMLRDQTTSITSTMNARFDAVDARFNHEREYNDLRFNAIEHRLDGIESDMTIIKGALIGKISA